MVDLDEMLLEAARRTGRNLHSTPPSRRQGKGSYSDDGSDSRDDDHGSADRADEKDGALTELLARKRLRLQDPDSHYNHEDTDSVGSDLYKVEEDRQMSELHREMILAERANRKMYKMLKSSIKKQKEKSNQRKDTVNRAARSSARSADSDDDSFGSDLYKGEEDRQRVSKMSELDRAMILAERANRKMYKKFKICIKKHKEKSNQGKARPPPHTVNLAGQSSDRADAKDVVPARKRLRLHDPESHYNRKDADKRNFTSPPLNNSNHSDSGSHSEDEDSTGDSDDEKMSKESSVLKYEVVFRTSKLAKSFSES